MKRLGFVLLVAAAFALVVAPALAAPPKGKHYASMLVMVDPETGEIDASPACLSFTRGGEMCTEFDDCGTWEFVAKRGHQNEWRGTLEFVNEDGTNVKAALRGVTERAGTGNSIAATVLATLDGVAVNAAIAGTRVSRSACLEFGLSED